MVNVSYRKWMRLKANVNWKLKEECQKAIKAALASKEQAEKRLKITELALFQAQNAAIKLMDKYESKAESYPSV